MAQVTIRHTYTHSASKISTTTTEIIETSSSDYTTVYKEFRSALTLEIAKIGQVKFLAIENLGRADSDAESAAPTEMDISLDNGATWPYSAEVDNGVFLDVGSTLMGDVYSVDCTTWTPLSAANMLGTYVDIYRGDPGQGTIVRKYLASRGIANVVKVRLSELPESWLGAGFVLEDANGTVGFWFNNGADTAPATVAAATRVIEVDIGAAIIHAGGQFKATTPAIFAAAVVASLTGDTYLIGSMAPDGGCYITDKSFGFRAWPVVVDALDVVITTSPSSLVNSYRVGTPTSGYIPPAPVGGVLSPLYIPGTRILEPGSGTLFATNDVEWPHRVFGTARTLLDRVTPAGGLQYSNAAAFYTEADYIEFLRHFPIAALLAYGAKDNDGVAIPGLKADYQMVTKTLAEATSNPNDFKIKRVHPSPGTDPDPGDTVVTITQLDTGIGASDIKIRVPGSGSLMKLRYTIIGL